MTDFQAPGTATVDDFERIDMRVGRIVAAEPFPRARVPAYRLTIDFGRAWNAPVVGATAGTYPDPAVLIGRLVIAVVNFAPRNIAGFESEVLVLGALPADGSIPLLGVDAVPNRAIRSAEHDTPREYQRFWLRAAQGRC